MGIVKVWDAENGREQLALKGQMNGVNSVAFSPDGKLIINGGITFGRNPRTERQGTVEVWNAATGEKQFTLGGLSQGVRSVAFSPDGKFIVSISGDGTLKVWDTENGQDVRTVALKGYATQYGRHGDAIGASYFGTDGKRIVSASDYGTVRVWDAESGQEQFSVTLEGANYRVVTVAFSRDGKRIVSGNSDGSVKLYDAASGQELLTLRGLTVANLKTQDLRTGEIRTLEGESASVNCLVFSPNGNRLACGSDTVIIWEACGDHE
jgi:WD40 repeat protein